METQIHRGTDERHAEKKFNGPKVVGLALIIAPPLTKKPETDKLADKGARYILVPYAKENKILKHGRKFWYWS